MRVAWLGASAAMGILTFTAAQFWRDEERAAQRHRAVRQRLQGLAWVARRSCEHLMAARRFPSLWSWAALVTAPDGLSKLESKMLELLTVSAEGGREVQDTGRAVFDAFLAATDLSKDLHQVMSGAETDQHGIPRLSDSESGRIYDISRSLLEQLGTVVEGLETFAPRRSMEPAVPSAGELPKSVVKMAEG